MKTTSQPGRTITRTRELQACTECRRRKLRCDRGKPCGACAKRDDQSSCFYERFSHGARNDREHRFHAEARLKHLEQLVQQLAQSKTNNHSTNTSHTHPNLTPASDNSGGPDHSGIDATNAYNQVVDQTEIPEAIAYAGSTHWSAMLEDIEVLKDAITTDSMSYRTIDVDVEEIDEIGVIFGATVSLPLEEILRLFLPERKEADRLTSLYFRTKSVAAPFIHPSQFRRSYLAFWKDPLTASPLWTSILFTICHIAEQSLSRKGSANTLKRSYSIAAAHCLASGEYYKGKRFAVEALCLFAQATCFTRFDIAGDVGVIFGVLIRVATRSGYHRDPDGFNLSPFEKEMRRRTWSMCMQLDLLFSFQLGLPSNVQYPTWDTQPPRNIANADFDEDCKELPPPRPDTDITDNCFYIAKHKLASVFERVLRHTLTAKSDMSSETVDQLDKEVRDMYAQLPKIWRPQPMADSFIDSPYLIVTRLCVYFIYQKSLCVLHRKYVTLGRLDSILTCHDAASNILRHFSDVYNEFQPGGQLESERWFMGALTWHDYLLAAMALCLVICSRSHRHLEMQVDLLDSIPLLRAAQDICAQKSRQSRDTNRVHRLITATLLQFGTDANGNTVPVSGETSDSPAPRLQPSSGQVPPGQRMSGQLVFPSPESNTDSLILPSKDLFGWDENMGWPDDDPGWAYLEQFLNMPNECSNMEI